MRSNRLRCAIIAFVIDSGRGVIAHSTVRSLFAVMADAYRDDASYVIEDCSRDTNDLETLYLHTHTYTYIHTTPIESYTRREQVNTRTRYTFVVAIRMSRDTGTRNSLKGRSISIHFAFDSERGELRIALAREQNTFRGIDGDRLNKDRTRRACKWNSNGTKRRIFFYLNRTRTEPFNAGNNIVFGIETLFLPRDSESNSTFPERKIYRAARIIETSSNVFILLQSIRRLVKLRATDLSME